MIGSIATVQTSVLVSSWSSMALQVLPPSALLNTPPLVPAKRVLGVVGSIARAFAGPLTDVDLWHVWDNLTCPTLLIRGGESDLLLADTLEEMTRRGPRTTVVQFDGVGHAPMLMSEEQIAPVYDFLLADD